MESGSMWPLCLAFSEHMNTSRWLLKMPITCIPPRAPQLLLPPGGRLFPAPLASRLALSLQHVVGVTQCHSIPVPIAGPHTSRPRQARSLCAGGHVCGCMPGPSSSESLLSLLPPAPSAPVQPSELEKGEGTDQGLLWAGLCL